MSTLYRDVVKGRAKRDVNLLEHSRHSINGVTLIKKRNDIDSSLTEGKMNFAVSHPTCDMVQLVDLGTILDLSSHVIGKHKNTYLKNLWKSLTEELTPPIEITPASQPPYNDKM